MKENITKGVISTALAALGVYFQIVLIPLIVLGLAVIVDYITGLAKAWITSQLNSKIGFKGIIKKLSYFVIVLVGMGVDWILQYGLLQIGITYSFPVVVALIVIVWLIINEMISILENLSVIGVPLPGFLVSLVGKLKNTVDEKIGGNE